VYILFISSLFALPRFSVEESSSCMNCHINPTGGGMRNGHGTNVYNLDELTLRNWISDGDEDWDGFISNHIQIGGEFRIQSFDGNTSSGIFPMQAEIYTKVDINKKVHQSIVRINQKTNEINENLIKLNYETSERKQRQKDKVVTLIQSLNNEITKLTANVDDKVEVKTSGPINPNAILRDIKKKYSSNSKIREDIDYLLDEKLQILSSITEKRNKAAHFRYDNNKTELDKEEIDNMLVTLKIIILRLESVAMNAYSY